MAKEPSLGSRTSGLEWITVEACADEATAIEVRDLLATAGLVVRAIGPEDWREAEVPVPDEPWEVQVPDEALGRAVDALESWDEAAS